MRNVNENKFDRMWSFSRGSKVNLVILYSVLCAQNQWDLFHVFS